MVKKNKKGWVKIIEAFVAILILLGFLMVIISQHRYSNEEKIFMKKNNAEILKGIETNSTLRNAILSESLPSNSSQPSFPENVKEYLLAKTLTGETCSLYICELGETCLMQDVGKETYSNEVLLFAGSTYSPRKLKLFCNLE
ncbi:hypothetical protein COU58_03635 [Candidatus Pacearchaeota archaeon CG10_big_fil_rev_8_21_14_0_10_32_42]|nr:hypothetical protein [Candidatus Pacearchaeota archaeon]PJE81221.1 MAG: hypothetical protein COU58_03635 [Candidatus Pacearchaeota archaeon CG10_big_fil_rev_8_21_14_0_10_32_42]